VLVYHRFAPTAADSMTVSTQVFEAQLKYLRDNGHVFVSLRDVVNFVAGRGSMPARAVAVTADDGHRTVFTEMKPIVERYKIPVTLFIYPSAISNASYAMTWNQLAQLRATGWFGIESHTYWHPNFRIEKRRLSSQDYRAFVKLQLANSRQVLERHLGITVDELAWPFGIYDDDLIVIAREAGYVAGFTIERHHASRRDNVMTIPRYLITDGDRGATFAAIFRETPPNQGR